MSGILGTIVDTLENGNGTTPDQICLDVNVDVAYIFPPLLISLIVVSRLLYRFKYNWLGVFTVIPFGYIFNYYWLVYPASWFRDNINITLVHYTPMIAAMLCAFIVICIWPVAVLFIIFIVSTYVMSSLPPVYAVIGGASAAVAIFLFAKWRKLQDELRGVVMIGVFGFGFLMSYMTLMIDSSPCRNYYAICDIRCTVIANETASFTSINIALVALMVIGAAFLGQWLRYKWLDRIKEAEEDAALEGLRKALAREKAKNERRDRLLNARERRQMGNDKLLKDAVSIDMDDM